MVYALHVHIPQSWPRLVGSGVGQVIRLLLSEGGLGIEVADIQGALDVVLQAGASQPYDVDHPGAGLRRRGEIVDVGFAVDQQLVGFGVVPHGGLQGFQFVFGEVVCGPLPDSGRLHDVGVAVESGEALGHWPESLDWQGGPLLRNRISYFGTILRLI